ncbi:hypothetical protein L6164_001648 [Bauhinia variegata]|uniref:Uncharacterized protein n=1 Tax=Bauhinia variegata TaxID=167791 RepID=A0ACB9QA23_BAUVA|nr:hypothetical protein L6164_001648 [Bauhinia variegata]
MDVFNHQIKKTPTSGRKKIEIKELDKNSNKQVTFSKRRAGLFKKASELCVLCNTQLAIIVFSPADKPFCFGQPNADAVLRRYLGGTLEFEASLEAKDNSFSHGELNTKYEEAMRVLELERKRMDEIENLAKAWDQGNWWDQPIDDMDVEQLEQYTIAMHELRRKLTERADELRFRFPMLPYGANPNATGAVNFTGFLNQIGGKKFGF